MNGMLVIVNRLNIVLVIKPVVELLVSFMITMVDILPVVVALLGLWLLLLLLLSLLWLIDLVLLWALNDIVRHGTRRKVMAFVMVSTLLH